MNANELAEYIQEAMPEAATMLRQQQAKLTKYELRHAEQRKRIEELETLERQQQAEIEALRWQVGILKEDVAAWMDDAQGWHPDEAYFERLFNERK